jgi:sigma-B regulation protein RsbU (phosphoserine phosphatase)
MKQITDEAERFSRENVAASPRLAETIRNTDEIGYLASSIDHMEEQITDYIDSITKITAEKERISAELSLATQIQASVLPHIFPPFPDRKEFDIYASMDPAKEVGGDFYDFFLIDSDHLGLVIADVSGKGIPAALFMMSSKIIIQSIAMLGKTPGEVLTKTNDAICSGNQAGMFVTVWMGILEISTGNMTCTNAGHEYPVLKRADGDFELFRDKHGFVIGGMEGIRYKEYELQMNPGDKLFVYTDGVPEATDADNELFGTERMTDALNTVKDADPEHVLSGVRRAVDAFVKDAEQFDDLTMLCIEYRGQKEKADA